MTKTFTFILTVICAVSIGFAAEPAEVIDSGPATGKSERLAPRLDDRQVALNNQYQPQLDALTEQILAAPDNETRLELETQAQELKAEWNMARLQVLLEVAVEEGDTEKEAEVRTAIDAIENPVVRTSGNQARDPETHKPVEGGVR